MISTAGLSTNNHLCKFKLACSDRQIAVSTTGDSGQRMSSLGCTVMKSFTLSDSFKNNPQRLSPSNNACPLLFVT